MHELQNPMTGFKTLEHAFAQGFRMNKIPKTKDIYIEKDIALGTDRYTYARLKKLKVLQTVVLNENEPLNGKPCFCLFYGTLEKLRGTGVTIPFIENVLNHFKNNLPNIIDEYYLEIFVDLSNAPSLAVATKLFGESSHDGTDELTGEATRVWQTKITR